MNVLAINGSPRRKGNTATLLDQALQGAKDRGAETECVHLYGLDYKGCTSCFACKKIGGKSYGRCAMQDDITPILARVREAGALLLGSPLYFGVETGQMRAFLERLLFPFLTYTPGYASLFGRVLPTAFVYTMNIKESDIPAFRQDVLLERTRGSVARTLGSCELFLCTDTYQFDDYSKYLSTCWDPVAKAKRREEVFPLDQARARDLGARLAEAARC
ncbi:flavodoxin family protein [Fundidesulfovibrio butyratiphilus]